MVDRVVDFGVEDDALLVSHGPGVRAAGLPTGAIAQFLSKYCLLGGVVAGLLGLSNGRFHVYRRAITFCRAGRYERAAAGQIRSHKVLLIYPGHPATGGY